jgi:hypothetical protein
MQKVSFRKVSILGLVLMAASAVTAAVLPAQDDENASDRFANGSLTNRSALNGGGVDSSLTCAPDTGGGTANCNATSQDVAGSETTGVQQPDDENDSTSATAAANTTNGF